MVIIRFDNTEDERHALGWLAGRFSFKTWSNGDLMVHEETLPYLAREGIAFNVKGPASAFYPIEGTLKGSISTT